MHIHKNATNEYKYKIIIYQYLKLIFDFHINYGIKMNAIYAEESFNRDKQTEANPE